MDDLVSTTTTLREELHRTGFVRIPRSVYSLDHDTTTVLQDEFTRLFQGEYDTGVYPDEIHWRSGISKDNVTRELCNAWKSSLIVRQVVCDAALGQLACRLMGWKSTRIGQDDVIDKPPNSDAARVGFHQDGPYISDNFEPSSSPPPDANCLTLWMALEDADDENGAMQYAPASHLWKSSPDNNNNNNDARRNGDANNHTTNTATTTTAVSNVSASSFHVVAPRHENKCSDDTDDHPPYHFQSLCTAAAWAGLDPHEVCQSVETVPVKAGEMVVHHPLTWHGSGPNTSLTRHRRALVVHLINGNVRWRKDGIPPHYIYGRYYIRGESIPREDFFPITYSCGDCPNNEDNNEEPSPGGPGGSATETIPRRRTPWLDD